ncbi:MAG: T9SS type A sorting domain-containing protein [Saprospiraceae bacterium]
MEKHQKYSWRIILCLIAINYIWSIVPVNAQRNFNKNWVLGSWSSPDDNKGELVEIRFNDTGIIDMVEIVGPFHIREGVACISDKNGVLKTWTNHCAVFNRMYDTLIGSYRMRENDLGGYCRYNGGSPFASSVMIIPWPGQEGVYQLFYTNENGHLGLASKYKPFISYLNGAVLDFRNNPQGEITQSWQLLYEDTITVSHLTACRHRNASDWWICTPMDAKPCYAMHTLSDTGYAFHHQQCLGDRNFGNQDAFGQASFSPDGKYYARYYSSYGLHLFEFNDSTGMLSNPRYIDIPLNTVDYPDGGICFSPNSRFIYIPCQKYLFQYDLEEKDIEANYILIDTLDLTSGKEFIADFNQAALGPDGRIYICGAWNHRYLHVINRPNCKGKDCDLVQQSIHLPVENTFGIPNVPHFINWKDRSPDCITTKVIDHNSLFDKVKINVLDKFLKMNIDDELINTRMELFNIDGRILTSELLVKNYNSISLLQLPEGIYLIRLSKNGRMKTFRIFNF